MDFWFHDTGLLDSVPPPDHYVEHRTTVANGRFWEPGYYQKNYLTQAENGLAQEEWITSDYTGPAEASS